MVAVGLAWAMMAGPVAAHHPCFLPPVRFEERTIRWSRPEERTEYKEVQRKVCRRVPETREEEVEETVMVPCWREEERERTVMVPVTREVTRRRTVTKVEWRDEERERTVQVSVTE